MELQQLFVAGDFVLLLVFIGVVLSFYRPKAGLRALMLTKLAQWRRQYPIFVYGTLRPGGADYSGYSQKYLLEATAPIKLRGYRLILTPKLYPVAVEAGSGTITGVLLTPGKEHYSSFLAASDFLESALVTPLPLYGAERRLIEVEWGGKSIKAWCYCAPAKQTARLLEARPLLPQGDWVLYSKTLVTQAREKLYASAALTPGHPVDFYVRSTTSHLTRPLQKLPEATPPQPLI